MGITCTMQFTIRDLLWLTVVVAFAILWQGEMRQRSSENADVWRSCLALRNECNTAAIALAQAKARIRELERLRDQPAGSSVHTQRSRSL